jgi:hypothetical protein
LNYVQKVCITLYEWTWILENQNYKKTTRSAICLNAYFLWLVYLQEILMRKKQVSNLDNRYVIMIENAYYYCNPPESKQIERHMLNPLHEYIKKILYKDLNKLCVEKVGYLWVFLWISNNELIFFFIFIDITLDEKAQLGRWGDTIVCYQMSHCCLECQIQLNSLFSEFSLGPFFILCNLEAFSKHLDSADKPIK